jgi:hypothetical protein
VKGEMSEAKRIMRDTAGGFAFGGAAVNLVWRRWGSEAAWNLSWICLAYGIFALALVLVVIVGAGVMIARAR